MKDNNQERHGTVVDGFKTTAQNGVEGTPRIILVKDSVSGTSTTNTVRDSEMEQPRDGVKSCRQSCVLETQSIPSSKDTESQLSRTSELTLLETPVLLAVPGRATGDEGDVLALVNDQKSSSDEVSASQANIENTEVKEDFHERLLNATQTNFGGESWNCSR